MRKMGLVVLFLIGLVLLSACGTSDVPATATPTLVPTAAPTATPVWAEATITVTLPTIAPVPTPESLEANLATAWRSVQLPDGENVALVNGVPVTKSDYEIELRRQLKQLTTQYQLNWNDPEIAMYIPQIQQDILEQMLGTELIRQLASAQGVHIPQEQLENEIADLKESVLSQGYYSSWDEFLSANDVNEESLRALVADGLLIQEMIKIHGGSPEQEQVHAQHIMVDTEETAKEVLAKLEAGASFEDLVKEYSTDSGSKDSGGDLGWFPRGYMVAEFEEAAFSTAVGEISDIVQTSYGYHIIRVLGHEVRALEGSMLEEAQSAAFSEWYREQLSLAAIERLLPDTAAQ